MNEFNCSTLLVVMISSVTKLSDLSCNVWIFDLPSFFVDVQAMTQNFVVPTE